jgi:hypothetical protein
MRVRTLTLVMGFSEMPKKWKDPVKREASPETMKTRGDFGRFTDLMRKIVTPKDGAKRASRAAGDA